MLPINAAFTAASVPWTDFSAFVNASSRLMLALEWEGGGGAGSINFDK